ncbi:MAG: hypothetical protein E6J12_04665 [Chloroflexi bacterium]|nr:MAG: hypothetical protein E6J12_04665 [Chloroflexota bacterium]
MLTKAQWEWIAASRVLSRQRASIAVQEERLDRLLSSADQAMANAFTGGFRVAQTKLAISKVLPAESMASAALESAQIVALAILVREQMSQGEFSAHYRPFATVLPGPGYESPPAIDRQIALFMEFVPTLNGDAKTEVMAVSRALAEPPKPVTMTGAGAQPAVAAAAQDFTVPLMYSAAWKAAIELAHTSGRTISFRAAQDLAEQAAPHDGSGIVGTAGVAAGGIFMRDLLPIEQVLLLYEPFAAAFPYESLR